MPLGLSSGRDTPLLLGLDMGSTNVKAVAYEPDGRAVAQASVPTVTHYPRPTWAFFRPDELWSSAARVIRDVTARIDDPRRIAGVAVASMAEAGVPLDASGEPAYDAIAWFDRRTIPQRDRLGREIGEEELFARTGLSLQPIWSLCKLLWIKDNEPEAWSRSVRWLNIADFIAYNLSGEVATDWSLASRTLAFDIRRRVWEGDILRSAGVPESLFAPAVPSGTRIGSVNANAAAATGLPLGTAVVAGGHDHVCGALAAGVVERGQVLDSMGTAEALFLALDAPLSNPSLGRMGYTQGAHVAAGRYYANGGIYTSGASIEWLRSAVGGMDHEAFVAEAAATPVGSLGTTFIPHLRLSNAPNVDARARAAFIGLTSDSARGTLARAVLEGLAYEGRATLEPLLDLAGLPKTPKIAVIGGGAKNDLLLRIKASVMQTSLHVLDIEEGTALGAAILGGLGAGIYLDVADALASIRRRPRVIEPEPESAVFYDTIFRDVYAHIFQALRPLNHRIHDLTAGSAAAEPSR
jgi:xylulokinase